MGSSNSKSPTPAPTPTPASTQSKPPAPPAPRVAPRRHSAADPNDIHVAKASAAAVEPPGSKVSPQVGEFLSKFFPDKNEPVTLDGFEDLFGRLGLDLTTASPFVFLFLAQCTGVWEVTKEDMRAALEAHGLLQSKLTPSDVRRAVDREITQLQRDDKHFIKFFEWAFGFCRENPGARSIRMESALEPLRVLLAVRTPKQYQCCTTDELLSFLEKETKVVTKDLFKQIPLFLIKTPATFAGYDSECWNSAIDAFVEDKQAAMKGR